MPTTPTPALDEQEPAYRCTSCSQLLFADELNRFACWPCESRANQKITALPTLYKQLSYALAPRASRSNTGRISSTSHEAPLPVNLHVLDLLGPGGIASKLAAIEDSWRTARGRTVGPRTDGIRWFATNRAKSPSFALVDHTTFIAYNLRWACEAYEEVAYDLGVIHEVYAKAETALTGHRRRRMTVSCVAEYDDGTTCGAELGIDVSAAYTICAECGARWGRDDWLRLHEATQVSAA